jgi:hypothetical protein
MEYVYVLMMFRLTVMTQGALLIEHCSYLAI